MAIIEEILIKRRIETGDRYVTDIGEIDIGFGNHLLKVIDAIKEANNAKFANFYKFTLRKKSEKLYWSTEPDPKRFIRQLRSKYLSKDSEKNKTQRDALPLIYFHRAAGMDQSLTGDEVLEKKYGCITENDAVVAEVDKSPITMTYMVYLMAWDQPTLDKLASGVTLGLLTNTRKIPVKISVLSIADEVEATINPVNSMSWVDISPANIDDRLLVLQGTIEVKASILQARCVQESDIKLVVNAPIPMYCTGEAS